MRDEEPKTMLSRIPSLTVIAGLLVAVAASAASAQTTSSLSILPTGMGEAVDRDITRLRAATERLKASDAAIAAGYKAETNCVQHQPHGAMGIHFNHPGLRDATLDVEKPEVLVYEKRPDGTLQLNGVEFLVPFTAWTKTEPPSIMGQSLKRADSLGFWYLHVWNWTANPSGLFADWNPNVKC
jgi:hypothetical protein